MLWIGGGQRKRELVEEAHRRAVVAELVHQGGDDTYLSREGFGIKGIH
jgi:hypothetical protein